MKKTMMVHESVSAPFQFLTFNLLIYPFSKIGWLTYLMNFPLVDIVDKKSWFNVDAPRLFNNLADEGFPEPELDSDSGSESGSESD